MKYALFNGKRTKANQAVSGDIGYDLWYNNYPVKACVGKYRQYWQYVGEKPILPNGYEPETDWHAAWKEVIEDEYCEVICGENREHRADIKSNDYVIEIQRSPMDGWAVIERNKFYKELTGNRLIWIVNIERVWNNSFKTGELHNDSIYGQYFDIIWKRAWSWVKEIAKTKDTDLFLDFNTERETLIKMWYHKDSDKLYGRWYKKQRFFDTYLYSIAKEDYRNGEKSFLNVFKDIKK